MFARTKRLTLRPGWPEDAPAVAAALAHHDVARMLSRVPYPYAVEDAAAFLDRPRGPCEPRFLITAHGGAAPAIVGGIAITDHGEGAELGYWLTRDAWGRGYATEAGRAVIEMARHALPLARIDAWHFLDNPASGRVLRKLGFQPTGTIVQRRSTAREGESPAAAYTLDLDGRDCGDVPIAA